MTRRAGVSRGVIFRGQGEVDAQVGLNTNMANAPFNQEKSIVKLIRYTKKLSDCFMMMMNPLLRNFLKGMRGLQFMKQIYRN